VQLLDNAVTIYITDTNTDYQGEISSFTLAVHGIDGYEIRKKPLEQLIGQAVNKKHNVAYLRDDKFSAITNFNINGSPDKIIIKFPDFIANGEKITISDIEMNKTLIDKKFLGRF
jgi:dimeric dUTPase (all-alpha-NTP-PPase superfamily)